MSSDTGEEDLSNGKDEFEAESESGDEREAPSIAASASVSMSRSIGPGGASSVHSGSACATPRPLTSAAPDLQPTRLSTKDEDEYSDNWEEEAGGTPVGAHSSVSVDLARDMCRVLDMSHLPKALDISQLPSAVTRLAPAARAQGGICSRNSSIDGAQVSPAKPEGADHDFDVLPKIMRHDVFSNSSGSVPAVDSARALYNLQSPCAPTGDVPRVSVSFSPSALDPNVLDISQLPSASTHWRVPHRLAAPSNHSGLQPDGSSIPTAAMAQRGHDAVPSHFKQHSWNLASIGQERHGLEEPLLRQAWAAPMVSAGAGESRQSAPHAQPPLGGGLQPSVCSPGGVGGVSTVIPVSVEAQLVDRLAQRFILERKAPAAERRERSAYEDMLSEVAWTALEPPAAQEAALLLSKKWLAPVTSTEVLRAFRRSLHSILTDERVLDVVEHQMDLHFGRLIRDR